MKKSPALMIIVILPVFALLLIYKFSSENKQGSQTNSSPETTLVFNGEPYLEPESTLADVNPDEIIPLYAGDNVKPDQISDLDFPDNHIDTSNWKTYHNKEYGFEFKYPPDWRVKETFFPEYRIELYYQRREGDDNGIYLNISQKPSNFGPISNPLRVNDYYGYVENNNDFNVYHLSEISGKIQFQIFSLEDLYTRYSFTNADVLEKILLSLQKI